MSQPPQGPYSPGQQPQDPNQYGQQYDGQQYGSQAPQYGQAPQQPQAQQPAAPNGGQQYGSGAPAGEAYGSGATGVYGSGAAAAAPGHGQQAPAADFPSRKNSTEDPGFFKALFDFRFKHYVTLKFLGILYVLIFVVAALTWISWIVCGFAAGAINPWGDYNPVFGILAILFGWIPGAFYIVFGRVALEWIAANVRTAQNTSKLVEAQSGD
ncbi:DUF4282 domain-containing protein [Brevibacterium litoralis]|uniref:DUF4282 domain-containing protein n=1 Tax=Brevibacterium litoralis TaxID=3138935 RepID=UPI0032ED2FD8